MTFDLENEFTKIEKIIEDSRTIIRKISTGNK